MTEFLSKVTTITEVYYASIFNKSARGCIKFMRQGKIRKGILPLKDDFLSTICIWQGRKDISDFAKVYPSPYSLDHVPSDFLFFPTIKLFLKHFPDDNYSLGVPCPELYLG